MSNYIKFNRHDVFSREDSTLVFNILEEVPLSKSNMVYGLFDGYWYDDLLYDLYTNTDVKGELLYKLETLYLKVKENLTK